MEDIVPLRAGNFWRNACHVGKYKALATLRQSALLAGVRCLAGSQG
jgi:hypothetical protein